MNHIYRLVWNHIAHAWVCCAETAKGRGKSSGGRKSRLIGAITLTAAALACTLAQAGPTGGQVSAGSGTIAQSGLNTTINQTSQNLAINWQGFSIAANESVRFNQPNASSIALNRVIGQDPSQILGSLSANGQVFVLNPNGVLFGANAQVNVGGLVATTLSLSDADLMAGRYAFDSSSRSVDGAVVNKGSLTAAQGGYIALLAPEVRNEGVISATLGTALLAAGNKVTLNLNSGSLLGYSIDQGAINALADNKQLIQADGGQVFMSAKAADALSTAVVNNTGIIQARTVQNVAGVIKLLGDMDHGTVHVGGTLDASAPTGGNGGFVETSAAKVVIAPGHKVTTAAAQGKTGTWLIDPNDYTIATGGGDITGAQLGSDLDLNNITIHSADGASSGNGDIFVRDNVSWSADTQLTLSAERNIRILSTITASGANGKVALLYGQGAADGVIGGTAASYDFGLTSSGFTGKINLQAGQNFSTQLGSGGDLKGYTVVTSLGTQASSKDGSLQGIGGGSPSNNYVLGADIDATDTKNWNGGAGFTPLFDPFQGTSLNGVFDGLGHTVSKLTINQPTTSYVGLFSAVGNGSVRNVGLVDASITGNGNVGALAGSLSGGFSSGVIDASYASGTVWGNSNVGGLVGSAGKAIISNSYATANLTNVAASDAGGLVGALQTGSIIEGSYAMGTVKGSGKVGGLVGETESTTAVRNSYSSATVTNTSAGSNSLTGGLVGYNTGEISNSFATGQVDSWSSEVGGLVGANGGGAISNSFATGAVSGTDNVGGLVGLNVNGGTLDKTYAQGYVFMNGGSHSGGLVGGTTSAGWASSGGAVTNSFWDTGLSAMYTSAGGTGKTSDEMMQASTFLAAGWDVSSTGGSTAVWRIYEGQSAPLLRRFLTPLTVKAISGSREYDGSTNGLGVAYSIPTPDSTLLLGTANVTLAGKDVGGYSAVASGLYSSSSLGYDISYASGGVEITPRLVNLTRQYDGTSFMNANSVSVSNLVNGDVLTLTGMGGVKAFNVSSGNPLIQGTLALGGSSASNYSLGWGSTASITPKVLTVSGAGVESKIYDATTSATVTAAGTLSGFVGSETVDISASSATFDSKNAGSQTATLSYTLVDGSNFGLASNYTASGSATATIAQKDITVSGLTANNKIYNGNTTATLGGTATVTTPIFSGDDVTLKGTATGVFASKDVGTGINITVSGKTLSGLDAGNYNLIQQTGLKANITPKALTLSGGSATSKAYDGTTDAIITVGTLSGFIGSEKVTATGSGSFASANASSNNINVTASYILADGNGGGLASNYSLANKTYTAKINKANLTLSGTRSYDATTTVAGAVLTATGVHGESFTVTGVGDSSNLASKNVQTGSTLASVTGLALGASSNGGLASNYNVLSKTGSAVSITQANLTLSASNVTKTYDGGLSASGTATISSGTLFGSDKLSGGTFAFTNKNVGDGNKTVTAAGVTVNDGNSGGNYKVSYVDNTTSTINQANITLSTSNVSKTYDGGTSASGTATVSNGTLFGSDSLTGGTFAFTDKNVGAGNKTVTATGVTVNDGNSGGNYKVSYVDNTTSTINQADLTLSTSNVSKTYDGGTSASGTATATNGTQLFGSDSLTGGTFAFTNKNVGAGNKTVTATGITVNDGNSGGNYKVSYVDNTSSTINQASLTLSGTRSYDATTTVAGAVLTAAGVNGESFTVTGLGDSSNLASKNVQTGSTLASVTGLALGASNNGGLASNYNVLSTKGSAVSISQADLQVTGLSASSRAYDGTTIATLTGTAAVAALGSDKVTLDGSASGVFMTKNAGTNIGVTVSGNTLSGADAGNYNLKQATGLKADITPRALTITGSTAADKIYDGSTTASVTAGTLSGFVKGESVSVASTSASFDTKNVGDKKVVTVNYTLADGLVLNSALVKALAKSGDNGLASNYVATETLSASITKADLLVTGLSASNKTYDGTTAATLTGTATVAALKGDKVAVDGIATGVFADKAIGSDIAVTVSGNTLSGLDAGNYKLVQQTGLKASITRPEPIATASPAGDQLVAVQVTIDEEGRKTIKLPTQAAPIAIVGEGQRLPEGLQPLSAL